MLYLENELARITINDSIVYKSKGKVLILMVTLIVFFICMLVCFNLFSTSIGVFAGLVFIWCAFIHLLIRRGRIKKPKISYFIFFIIWLFYALLQMFYVEQLPRTVNQLQVLFYGIILIFLMGKLINSPKRIETIYKFWGIGVLCTIIIAWWEILTNNHLPQSGADFYLMENVATVTFYNPNDYCYFLALSIPVILHWIGLRGLYKVTGLFMLLSAFYIMFMNEARLIIILFALSVFAYSIKLWKEKRYKMFIFFATIVAISSFYFKDTVQGAIESVTSVTGTDASLNVRADLTNSALNIFKQHPFGVGPGNLELYLPRIQFGSSVHNFWLEILLNYGVIIFVLFILFYSSALLSLLKIKSKDLKRKISPILWSSVIFVPACVQSSSVFSFNITWFLFGLIICALNIKRKEEVKKVNETYKTNVGALYVKSEIR